MQHTSAEEVSERNVVTSIAYTAYIKICYDDSNSLSLSRFINEERKGVNDKNSK
jgi:hypothetical protein